MRGIYREDDEWRPRPPYAPHLVAAPALYDVKRFATNPHGSKLVPMSKRRKRVGDEDAGPAAPPFVSLEDDLKAVFRASCEREDRMSAPEFLALLRASALFNNSVTHERIADAFLQATRPPAGPRRRPPGRQPPLPQQQQQQPPQAASPPGGEEEEGEGGSDGPRPPAPPPVPEKPADDGSTMTFDQFCHALFALSVDRYPRLEPAAALERVARLHVVELHERRKRRTLQRRGSLNPGVHRHGPGQGPPPPTPSAAAGEPPTPGAPAPPAAPPHFTPAMEADVRELVAEPMLISVAAHSTALRKAFLYLARPPSPTREGPEAKEGGEKKEGGALLRLPPVTPRGLPSPGGSLFSPRPSTPGGAGAGQTSGRLPPEISAAHLKRLPPQARVTRERFAELVTSHLALVPDLMPLQGAILAFDESCSRLAGPPPPPPPPPPPAPDAPASLPRSSSRGGAGGTAFPMRSKSMLVPRVSVDAPGGQSAPPGSAEASPSASPAASRSASPTRSPVRRSASMSSGAPGVPVPPLPLATLHESPLASPAGKPPTPSSSGSKPSSPAKPSRRGSLLGSEPPSPARPHPQPPGQSKSAPPSPLRRNRLKAPPALTISVEEPKSPALIVPLNVAGPDPDPQSAASSRPPSQPPEGDTCHGQPRPGPPRSGSISRGLPRSDSISRKPPVPRSGSLPRRRSIVSVPLADPPELPGEATFPEFVEAVCRVAIAVFSQGAGHASEHEALMVDELLAERLRPWLGTMYPEEHPPKSPAGGGGGIAGLGAGGFLAAAFAASPGGRSPRFGGLGGPLSVSVHEGPGGLFPFSPRPPPTPSGGGTGALLLSPSTPGPLGRAGYSARFRRRSRGSRDMGVPSPYPPSDDPFPPPSPSKSPSGPPPALPPAPSSPGQALPPAAIQSADAAKVDSDEEAEADLAATAAARARASRFLLASQRLRDQYGLSLEEDALLRSIFLFYCVVGEALSPSSLTSAQFFRLLRDCRIVDAKMPRSVVDVMWSSVAHRVPATAGEGRRTPQPPSSNGIGTPTKQERKKAVQRIQQLFVLCERRLRKTYLYFSAVRAGPSGMKIAAVG
eukprot:tig00000215_g18544.t1